MIAPAKIGEARGALAPLGCGAFPLSANANRKRGRGSTLSTLRRAQRASREPYVHSPQPCQRPGTAPTPRQTPLQRDSCERFRSLVAHALAPTFHITAETDASRRTETIGFLAHPARSHIVT
jgi:hypothetical protein